MLPSPVRAEDVRSGYVQRDPESPREFRDPGVGIVGFDLGLLAGVSIDAPYSPPTVGSLVGRHRVAGSGKNRDGGLGFVIYGHHPDLNSMTVPSSQRGEAGARLQESRPDRLDRGARRFLFLFSQLLFSLDRVLRQGGAARSAVHLDRFSATVVSGSPAPGFAVFLGPGEEAGRGGVDAGCPT